MALRFLIGAAGTGKTEYCMKEIITAQSAHRGRQIFLVPEQYTSQAERDLTARTERKGILTAEVLSFGRLAHQFFAKNGLNRAVILGDVGKQMALQKILLEQRDDLPYFCHMMDKNGFVSRLGKTITEFFRYRVTPEQLETMSNQEGLSHSVQDKCRDMASIYRRYEEFLSETYLTGDTTLSLLEEKLASSAAFEDTEIWLDGFYGFTPQEYGVIAQLLRLCKRVSITLPMDEHSYFASSLPPAAPFFEPHLTKQKLVSLAEEMGIAMESPVFFKENHRAKTPALAFLEKNYFYGYYKKSPDHEGIHICSCATRESEMAYAAGQILSLVREQGLRYRDIAIVTNAMSAYEKGLKGILSEAGIPCFVDSRRDIASHPLIGLVNSLLECVVYDFRYESVFSYLKTGLTPMAQEDMDILENYVLAYGIKGYKWKKDVWAYGFQPGQEAEQAYLNDLRAQVMTPFASLLALKRKKNLPLRDWVTALVVQLDTLGIAEKLTALSEAAAAKGNAAKAEEHRQIWQILMDVLQKAVEILGDAPMSLDTFARILSAGLEESSMGLIPPTADSLLVGDIERSRLPDIKALLVLGVNDGILPAPAENTGIFTETEREALTAAGMELAPDGKRKLFEEQFLIYRGLTKPSHALYLTYANGDTEGKALFPSSLIARIAKMYPTLAEERDDALPLSSLTPGGCFHQLGTQMRKHVEESPMEPLWQDIYSYFATTPQWQQRLSLLRQGFSAHDRRQKLSPKTAKNLYGKNILSSVSRLERFAACPFAYFAEYGLKARPRQLYQLRTPDLGNLFHQVLEQFATTLKKDGISWQTLTQEETERRMDAAVDEAAPHLGNEILMDSAANRYLIKRLKRISRRAGWTLVRHIQSGMFEPAGYEVGFGPHEALPPIVIGMSDGSKLILRGKIDRVDLLDAEGNKFVKIIDYKSGTKAFDFQDIYYGLQLQLLLYLDAYLKNHGTESYRPGGVFYFRITDPTQTVTEEMSAEEIEHLLYSKMQMSGLVLENETVIKAMDEVFVDPVSGGMRLGASDIIPLKYTKKGTPTASSLLATEEEYNALMAFTAKRAATIGESMKAGIITPAPYRKQNSTPCDYCVFSSICRYEYKDRPYYRNLKKIGKEDFWENLNETDERK
ncbi:helicase-exonuclease AddAB subunit AddB [Anaerotignum lactatifermentans]|uniref:helicase-exonuclease AddAB subunit AddB n=1 Tax=Anaerotignum lactatifermentans TaxID=160404 RepID=UPI0017485405|nr:helicase-exonuclease AddAB subunit AddB [Anaerotignum lactatifermentans]HJE93849.1 helicase-exonuclease AddAB subunit AddB [Anaerotignum lactatifermentans]